MELVERIKEICKQKNTSMGALEKELGLANGSIRRWDDKTPGADKILKIANRLDISIDYLLTGKDGKDLTPEEQKLVDYYRKADDRGKRNILRTAEQESQELEYATSKIG
jgi:transcriptional regulator with XRE-family HTH domain